MALIWISGRSLLSSTAFHSNAVALRGEWAMKVTIMEIDYRDPNKTLLGQRQRETLDKTRIWVVEWIIAEVVRNHSRVYIHDLYNHIEYRIDTPY